jgi:hypothetical protein
MERSWKERIRALENLGLIRLHRNDSTGEIIAVLLEHPINAVDRLLKRRDIPRSWSAAWRERLDEVQNPPA